MIEPDLPPDNDISAPEAFRGPDTHVCEVTVPGRCIFTAAIRVKFWKGIDHSTEMDVCQKHTQVVAKAYPDCIETVKVYKHNRDMLLLQPECAFGKHPFRLSGQYPSKTSLL